jgi:hypothetical protein
MLVGLLGKNAILVVEFAVQRHRDGMSLKDAAIEGGKLRFRPILMTSFAFIAGLLPLVRATGPGAIGNRTIGTAAAGGMLVGTVIGVLVIPGLYYLFGRIADKRKLIRDEADEPLSEVFEHRAREARDGDGNGDRLRHPAANAGAAALHSVNLRHGFDVRLMSWGNGSGVPTSGSDRIIVGTDTNGLLHIRSFDAGGFRSEILEVKDTSGALHIQSVDASGKVLADMLESIAQAGEISTLKQQLPGLLPPHVLSSDERSQVLVEVSSIVDQIQSP